MWTAGGGSPLIDALRSLSACLAAACALSASAGCAGAAARPAAEAPAAQRQWASSLGRNDPLVGRVWDVKGGRFVEESAMEAALARADFVLLGETHDNPDHHVLQAGIVRSLAATGRSPALAFEMLQTDQQVAVDRALVGSSPDPDALAAAVDWKHSVWPDFAIYRPLFAEGIASGLPILAADLPSGSVRRYPSTGPLAFPVPVRGVLDRAARLSPAAERAVRDEMARVHCGLLPATMLGPLVDLRRAHDASLAWRLLTADHDFAPPGNEQGAILVAGLSHVRRDRGVPRFLDGEAPTRSVVTVGFLEVSGAARAPEAYADAFGAASLPFDYVVFTPATARENPCEEIRKGPPPPAKESTLARASVAVGSPPP